MKKANNVEQKIQVLEGLSGIRKRPGMYIGSVSREGLHHLIWEVVDNALDEINNGFGNKIKIILKNSHTIQISDNGRGLPIKNHSKYKKPAINLIFEKLHSGGKFNNENYKVSSGLHGLGLAVVNALSEKLNIWTKQNNKFYYLSYADGGSKIVSSLKIDLSAKFDSNTIIEFSPSKNIFGSYTFDFELIKSFCMQKSFLVKNVNFELINEIDNSKYEYKYKNGLSDYLDILSEDKEPILSKNLYLETKYEEFHIEIIFNYFKNVSKNNIYSFVNHVHTIEGGTHVQGFKYALTKTINLYSKKNKILINDSFSSADICQNMIAIISIQVPEEHLEFEGQTKIKFSNQIARQTVIQVVTQFLNSVFYYNKKLTSFLFQFITRNHKINIELSNFHSKLNGLRRKIRNESMLAGKLIKCVSSQRDKCELFLVEGDSASGTAKSARDIKYQAILPLKGKIINSYKASLDTIIKNAEINMIISALEVKISDKFDISSLRYKKIILMADADVDGNHIIILLITFFWTYMKQIILNNHLYVACPPLYCVNYKNKKQYFWNENELQIWKNKHQGKSFYIQRYKGLGEMSSDQLWETTMDPERRKLILINVKDAQKSTDKINVLMGNNSILRKEWIAKNIDFSIKKENFVDLKNKIEDENIKIYE